MSNSLIEIQSYYPAIVKNYKKIGFCVEYYVFDPNFQKMVRFRVRLHRLLSRYPKKFSKKLLAQKIADDINIKLADGWSPFVSNDNARLYTPIPEVVEKYIKAKVKEGLRERTMSSYRSILSIFLRWCESKNYSKKYCGTFLKVDAVEFMDYVFDRGHGNRNYDNIMKGTKMFFEWAREHCYCKENPFDGIKLLPKEKKKRILIDHDTRSRIAAYFDATKPQMSIVVKLVYYSALRPNEIGNIKISDIHLDKRFIYVSEDNAKNGKSRCATLTQDLIDALKPAIAGMPQEYYLFGSGVMIEPGAHKVSSSYFRRNWQSMREELKLPEEMQLYSLRDTGLSDFLHAGIDQLTVQHHADHSSIAIQNIYTDHFDENLNQTIYEKAPKF